MDFRLVIIAIIAFAVGLPAILIALQAARSQQSANSTQHWSTTNGRIIASKVVESQQPVRRRPGLTTYRMMTFYGPHVTYDYVVAGKSYQANRLHVGQGLLSSESSDAERQAARYPTGNSVTVYFNPDNPAEATLSLKVASGTRILWLIALGLVVALVIVVIVVWNGGPITVR